MYLIWNALASKIFPGSFGEVDIKSLLTCNSMAAELVVRRKSCRVGTFCYFSIGGLFLGSVDSFAIGIEIIHEVHGSKK
jgi:hypothetical protein